MSIGEKQLQLINQAKNFIEDVSSSNIDASLSGFCYFASFAETPGYAKLKYWIKGWSFIFYFYKILLKNIFAIASKTKYVEFSKNNSSDSYETIVLSWCFQKNFDADGSFNDRYFKENSKDLPNSYWILISMDDYVPVNLNSNITVIKREKGIFKYNFFSFIKILISIFFECKFSPKKIFHYLYFSSYFSKIALNSVKKKLIKTNCKAVLIPYEAQNFQNKVFLETKKYNKTIKTIGYLHSLNSLTSELIYRSGAPDFLLVHGNSQIEILNSKLNWPKNKLILTQSFRHRLNQNMNLSNKIFLPLNIIKDKILIDAFEKLIKNSSKNNFPNFVIQNHPAAVNSKKHLKFIEKIEKIMGRYPDRFSSSLSDKKISIFFGVTDVLEALEKGINIIHICSDPILESYSDKIWQNLKVEQLEAFTFQYKLYTTGKYIIFGEEKKILHKTLKALYQ